MDEQLLEQVGLNDSQSQVYIHLIEHAPITPPVLAKNLDMKRTNAYALLDQLVDSGLAIKKDVNKKLTFWPTNPVHLQNLARAKRKEAEENEKHIEAMMPSLQTFFFKHSGQPGIRFYQGIDGIKEIYEDTLRTKEDIYVIRSPFDQDLMTTEFYLDYKQCRADLGITTHMINPDNDPEYWNSETDRQHCLQRSVIDKEMYTADAEISAYGNKVAIISFGKEAVGMILESKQAAEGYRQLFKLAQHAGRQA